MPGATVPFGFPYPLPADPTNGPGAVQALAEAVDTVVAATYTQLAGATSPPAVRVTGGTQVVATGVTTPLLFNAVVFDNAGWSDLVSAPSTVRVPGPTAYCLFASALFVFNVTGERRLELTVNGTVVGRGQLQPAATSPFATTVRCGLLRPLVAGDLVGLQVTQASGGNLQVLSCELAAFRFDD